jgi:hypothetical protein
MSDNTFTTPMGDVIEFDDNASELFKKMVRDAYTNVDPKFLELVEKAIEKKKNKVSSDS